MLTTAFKLKPTVTIFSFVAIAFPLPSLAVGVESVPNPRQEDGTWVTDMAKVLSETTEVKLNQLITNLEAQNGSEIAVVTVPDTAPSSSPKEFATDLFNHWGIGKAEADNGVLFLISTGDRRVEIETGYGIEGILPDAKVGNMIAQKITPRLKQGDYDSGTLAGTQALVGALQNQTGGTSQQAITSSEVNNTQDQSDSFAPWLIFAPILIVAVVLGLIFNKHGNRRRGSTSSSTRGVIGSGGSCSGGGSSGSSGFGGGSSGGGGAGGGY